MTEYRAAIEMIAFGQGFLALILTVMVLFRFIGDVNFPCYVCFAIGYLIFTARACYTILSGFQNENAPLMVLTMMAFFLTDLGAYLILTHAKKRRRKLPR